MNDSNSPAETALWQEAWAMLAQAWRPPTAAAQCQALRECLAADLSSIGRELGLALDTGALAAALAEPDDEALLVGYSRLFLAPPCAAYLDLGSGVDGSLLGAYSQTMARFLNELGLQLPADCHQRADYLPVVLEVVARLEAETAAAEWRTAYLTQLRHGLQPLRQALARHAPESPWCQLAGLTHQLVHHRLAILAADTPDQAAPAAEDQRRQQRAALTARVQQEHRHQPVSAAANSRAQQAGIVPEAILEMIERLEAQGLDASHLRGRLPAEGWASLTPPQARHGQISKHTSPAKPDSKARNKP